MSDGGGKVQLNLTAIASSATLAAVLWLGNTVQELDRKMPVIIYRLDVIEAQQQNQGMMPKSHLDQFSLKNGVDKAEQGNG